MAAFKQLDDAVLGLLISTATTLRESGVQFAIAGGWVPVLRRGPAGIAHPGTRDVDVLLSDSDNAVRHAADRLLAAGFVPSAKHEFQLLRKASVGSRDFIFNVDLMHPREASAKPELYEDIIDLGVTDAYDPTGKRWLKSVAFKSAAIVFEQQLWHPVEVEGLSFEGEVLQVQAPILTPAAFILSKCESVAVEKRTRDAFDLYYVLCAPDGDEVCEDLVELCRFPQVKDQLAKLVKWIEGTSEGRLVSNAAVFDKNVEQHARRANLQASNNVVQKLSAIISR